MSSDKSQKYTAEEVSRHNHEKDLWMVIHGGVHDLTKFLKEHPGGEEVLLNSAGQDGTKCFDEIGHSSEAITLCETFKIGELSDASNFESVTSKVAPKSLEDDDDWEYEEPKKESSSYLPLFIALGVLIYAFIFYFVWY